MVKIADLPLVTYTQLENQYGNDVERVCQDHEKLVELILEEEEELINGHRQHIDDVVDLVKQVRPYSLLKIIIGDDAAS